MSGFFNSLRNLASGAANAAGNAASRFDDDEGDDSLLRCALVQVLCSIGLFSLCLASRIYCTDKTHSVLWTFFVADIRVVESFVKDTLLRLLIFSFVRQCLGMFIYNRRVIYNC